jgi:LPS-assembly lipoprotein
MNRGMGFAVLAMAGMTLLGGCSYRPLYGSSTENAGVVATLSSIAIAEPTTRVGQIIRNDLISAMRPGNSGSGDRYTLTLTPEVKSSNVIAKSMPATTRQQVRLSVAYDLIDQTTGSSVHSGKTFSQASYDVVRQPFADTQAEADATARAAHEVSADIRTRLAAYFASQQ